MESFDNVVSSSISLKLVIKKEMKTIVLQSEKNEKETTRTIKTKTISMIDLQPGHIVDLESISKDYVYGSRWTEKILLNNGCPRDYWDEVDRYVLVHEVGNLHLWFTISQEPHRNCYLKQQLGFRIDVVSSSKDKKEILSRLEYEVKRKQYHFDRVKDTKSKVES